MIHLKRQPLLIIRERFLSLLFLLALVVFGGGLILFILKYPYLPPQIPLWYTESWGEKQLAPLIFLGLLPLLSLMILIGGAFLAEFFLRQREMVLTQIISLMVFLTVFLLNLSLQRIINLTAIPSPLPSLLKMPFLLPLAVAGLLGFIFTLPTIKIAEKLGFIDNPETHHHPGMLLKKPTPRAGSLPAFLALAVAAFIFVPHSETLIGLLLAGTFMTVVGVIDDKYDLNPYIRLLSQLAALVIVILAGVHITYVGSPVDGIIRLDLLDLKFNLLGLRHFYFPGDLLTVIWGIGLMNMLSWSNGVDGQFPGIVFLTAITIGILGERVVATNPEQTAVVTLAFLTGGAILGTLPFTWHPSKILYGFGATSFGLVLSALAILSVSKISLTILILSIPAMDAIFAVVRRIRRGQSPVWGDRGHLHHKLLDLGWNQRQIALFYWLITGILGILALLSSEKDFLLFLLTGAGLAGSILILANLEEGKLSTFLKRRLFDRR